jgi:hypothetical protein
MATNIETMWVSDQAQMQATVQTLVGQGGVVQAQYDTEVQVYLKKKMNIAVLIVGLVLCVIPGLAYLIWYSTSDQNQQITVKIGSPANIKTEHQHWYDENAPDAATPATPAAPGALPTSTPGSEIPAPAPPAMPAPAPLPDPTTPPPPTPLA